MTYIDAFNTNKVRSPKQLLRATLSVCSFLATSVALSASSPVTVMQENDPSYSKVQQSNQPALQPRLAAATSSANEKTQAMSLTLTSPAFAAGSDIPAVYTCDGKEKSPPLSWSGIPPNTKSLALIVDDPDAPDPAAPKRTWVHWVLYDLPPDSKGLPEGATARDLPAGTHEGSNDWKRTGYGGPCPPVGRHRYFFKLYALDTKLPEMSKPTKAQLEKAMQGHVIAQVEMIGRYQKQ